jgi:YrbI family 3-deoxy-D-manno-octulosonate 8-phosphate phosphatase
MVKSKNQITRLGKKIQIVITDVDGVLTDGGMYYSDKGESLKKFNTRDGMGFELLRKSNIRTIIMTREKSNIVKERGKKIKADDVYQGILQKEILLNEICKKNKISPEYVAYIGDDINDQKIMQKAGLSFTPNDGMEIIKKNVDYICKMKGGDGVFREVADLIINCKSQ